MIDLSKEIEPENLTQKDIMTFLLHSTQHTATREELQDVKIELKHDISKLDDKISSVELSLKNEISGVRSELKQDISDIRSELKQDISNVKDDIAKLDDKISKVDMKFDKIQWLIISTILTVLLKDYVIDFFKSISYH